MKTKFPGAYFYNKKEINEALESATLVIDAYLLLDLYRINLGTEMLKIINSDKIKNRLWLPYDVAWLYHHHVNKTLKDQIERIQATAYHFTAFMQSLEDRRNYPYVDDTLHEKTLKIGKEVQEALIRSDKFLTIQLRGGGTLKNLIEETFRGKVGEPYDKEYYSQLYDEAGKCFESKKNPCLSCVDTVEERVKWHNYIVWMQMQKYAMDNKQNIVFITNRTDENWFDIWRESIISTQGDLVDEFMINTSQRFISVSAHYFTRCFGENVLDKKLLEKLLTLLNNKAIIYPSSLKTTHKDSI